MTENRPFTCSYHQQGGEYDLPVQIINKDEEKMTEHSPFTCSDHHVIVNKAEKMIEHSSFTCSDHQQGREYDTIQSLYLFRLL